MIGLHLIKALALPCLAVLLRAADRQFQSTDRNSDPPPRRMQPSHRDLL